MRKSPGESNDIKTEVENGWKYKNGFPRMPNAVMSRSRSGLGGDREQVVRMVLGLTGAREMGWDVFVYWPLPSPHTRPPSNRQIPTG